MTELRHLQLVILGIMKDIDALCVKNNIEYYLLGGSAIGAIRHKGFIPWDDDLDIVMDDRNYQKFIQVCREQLNKEKYSLQVGFEDWPLSFTKIRLKGTKLVEYDDYDAGEEMHGIFVDIFKMDNVAPNKLATYWQYACGKYYLCYQLLCRSYNNAVWWKKVLMALSYPLKITVLRNFIKHQIEKYNNIETDSLGLFYGRTRYHNTIVKRTIFGTPKRVPFEDTEFFVAENHHEYLTQMFGNYMQLPPEEQRKGLHLVSVEFGQY